MTPEHEQRFAEDVIGRYANISSIASGIVTDLNAARKNPGPLQFVMGKAMEKAARSLVALIDIDPTDLTTVMRLQNDVKMFRDMISDVRDAVVLGLEAEAALDEATRQGIVDMTDYDSERYVDA